MTEAAPLPIYFNVAGAEDPDADLPPPAREKLTALRDRRDDLRGVLEQAMARLESAREAARLARAELNRLAALHDRGRLKTRIQHDDGAASAVAGDARVDAAREKLERAEAELARQQQRHDLAESAWREVGGLLTNNLDRYVAEMRKIGVAFVAAEPVELPRKVAADPAAAVDHYRAEREQLIAELTTVRRTPVPASTAKARAAQHVDRLAERGRLRVAGLLAARDRGIRFPETEVDISTFGAEPTYAKAHVADSAAVLVWLHRDTILERLHAAIDAAAADTTDTLEPKQREAKEAELLAAVLQVERYEEAAIECCESRGLAIARRPDADARSVLHLSADMPAPTL